MAINTLKRYSKMNKNSTQKIGKSETERILRNYTNFIESAFILVYKLN